MHLQLALALQVVWTGICHAAVQNYPAAWGHYDVCKSQIYSDEGLTWDYMACQPEAADMTQFLKVTLDPPNITCGDPPETYCALVSTEIVLFNKWEDIDAAVLSFPGFWESARLVLSPQP